MNKTKLKSYLFVLLALTFTSTAIAQGNGKQSWKQFRGNKGDGTIENTSLKAFLKQKPELIWKHKMGAAFSEISIENNIAYTMCGNATDSIHGNECIIALNINNGEKIWETKIDSMFFNEFGDGPRSTPAIGKDKIFCLSSFGKLTAVSKKDGKIVWQKDFMNEFSSKIPRWAFSTSPLLFNDKLIIEAGGTESRAFMAINPNNGEIIWQKGKGRPSYNTPIVREIDGQKQIIFAQYKKLKSYNEKGDTLWTCATTIGPTAMPILFDQNKIFLSGVHQRGYAIIEVKDGKAKQIFKAGTMKNDFSSTLYYNDHFYGFNVAALQCISAKTGEVKWTKRGYGKGSLIRVGDQLLVLSDKGKLIQIKAQPESYEELGNIQAIKGKSWTAPSFVNGKIFLRNLNEIACYQLQ
jgi:outer membrane protein assembly factor BamB